MRWSAGIPMLFSLIISFLTLSNLVDAKPAAVSVPTRTKWYGYDGFWSPVSIRVGTPPQWVDVFASTGSQETWVIGTSGCDGTQQCLDERGGVFRYNQSTTWDSQGTYFLGLDPNLEFGGKGTYGLDSIALSDTISVPAQIVSAINTTEYWLGFFGLGVKPTNLTGTDQKPFLSSLVENKSLVPSHSYGYTAGAHYRLKGVPGSLTLGGSDINRYDRNHNISFALDPNQNPTVAINQIVANAAPFPSSNTTLSWKDQSTVLFSSSQADLFTIDSSTPFLWLPDAVCQQFEKALGLTYDDDLELYIFPNNSNQHGNLVNWNISFEFTISDLPGSARVVNLTLPYGAFDLQLSYPYPGLNISLDDPAVNYFPLRKAANNTQYTIGRAFLQETYLIVDYERNNFSVFPATFSVDPLNNIHLMDISRPKNSTWKGPDVHSPVLSKGGIAGITIAAIIALAILGGLLFLIFKIRREQSSVGYVREGVDISRKSSNSKLVNWLFRGTPRSSIVEHREEHGVPELQGRDTRAESIHGSEMDGSNPTLRGYFEHDQRESKEPYLAVNAIGHDPSVPVELPYRSSNYRTSRRLDAVQELAPSPDQSGCPELPSPGTSYNLTGRKVLPKHSTVSSPTEGTNTMNGSDPFQIVSPITPDQDNEDEVSSLETIARRAAWYVSSETPSVSSESRGPSRRSFRPPGSYSIEGRAGFPNRPSRQNTVSSLDRTTTPGTPSVENPFSPRGSPFSYTKAPRNSRATNLGRAESTTTSGEESDTSTVSRVIRRSVQRGFSWLQPRGAVEGEQEQSETYTQGRTPNPAMSEASPYSPARWVEFWKTGRDPRLGPIGERGDSVGG